MSLFSSLGWLSKADKITLHFLGELAVSLQVALCTPALVVRYVRSLFWPFIMRYWPVYTPLFARPGGHTRALINPLGVWL